MKRMIVLVCILMLLALLAIPVLGEISPQVLRNVDSEDVEQRVPGCACEGRFHLAWATASSAPVKMS
jgi:hypothetical protein